MKNFLQKLAIQKKRVHPGILIGLAIIFILIISGYGAQVAIQNVYNGKLMPGVIIGDRSLGGLPLKEAEFKLQQTTDEMQEKGVTFCHEDRCIVINAAYTAISDPDLSYDLFEPNIEETIETAHLLGRRGSILTKFYEQWNLRLNKIVTPVLWNIDEKQIEEYLKTNFSDSEKPAVNTQITLTPQGSGYEAIYKTSQNGWVFNYEQAIRTAKTSLEKLETPSIKLIINDDFPTITRVNEDAIEKQIMTLLTNPQWSFLYNEREWPLNKTVFVKSLELQNSDKGVTLGINRDAFGELLEIPKIVLEKTPQDAKFEIENNRVIEFQSSRDGVEILEDATWNNVNNILQTATSSELLFPLAVSIIPSATPTASVNDLGITELLSAGKSDFSGSPANRRHNIKVGSDSLNGLLIAPGEEFSLVAALGDIDGTTGYKQELVIKGNETIPEFGGGLCQVGTTIFRSTLNAGLPITERQNHSYRVRYYEPAGTDATIYGPHPDYRFVNDTGHHILIQTHIKGDELIYEFWGTKDGRSVVRTDPIVYNITEPPPTKYIETLDLPPGKVNCTERAHRGADTSFDYNVTYIDGETKEETFNSHYRAWQEVCLIGVEELSEAEGVENEEPLEIETKKSLN